MRVVDVRKGMKKFYGAVYSYASLPLLAGIGQFQAVISPAALRDLDINHLDRVVSINHRLLGPVPYRGGDLKLEVGLFSIKAVDLAGPFLSVLEDLASTAGVSFFSAACPFVQPLQRGINLLMGIQGDNVLEVGLTRTFDKPETGQFLVMRAPKGTVDLSSNLLDEDYRLIDRQGRPISEYPYMVLSIEATAEREDWFQIPELQVAYNLLQMQFRDDKMPAVKAAWDNFQRVTLTCPDLLYKDAEKLLNNKVKPLIDKFLSPTPTAAGRIELPELIEMDLYDHG
jgi:hypothetical protein